MYDRDQLLDYLKEHGIESQTIDHAPVFTVEEAKEQTGHLPGAHVKNLFLVDKSGQAWLVTCLESTAVKVNGLARLLGAPRFSFGKPERLWSTLGVKPGSVTPLALINDVNREVRFVLDSELLKFETINVHPLVNSSTTAITRAGLERFWQLLGYEPDVVDLAASLTA